MAPRLLKQRAMRMLLALTACACAAAPGRAPVVTPPIDLTPIARAPVETLPSLAAAPLGPYSADVHSVRFLATTTLRKQPAATADKLGVIRKDARALPVAAVTGPGCATRWIQIAPRGWTCETAVLPSIDEPTAAPEVSFVDDEADVVRGIYGVVRGDVTAYVSRADAEAGLGHPVTGATSVRARGVVRVAGKRYWSTTGGDLIDAAAIATFSPSRFRGVALEGELQLPLAWTHGKRRGKVAVRATPDRTGELVSELAPRTVVTILEQRDGFVRTPDGWIARAELRVAALAAPPAELTGDERWLDVDLDDQVLVAYEGARPVYATLVSTGKSDRKTPTAIARVASKLETATMTSAKRDVYSVADVPWTMYYDHNFALHTSYWHDGFGDPRSHGCVNLAPRDARALYHWSSPDVPPGWIAVYGDADTPGSLVRVRSRAEPAPEVRGYARTMHEHRERQARRDGDAAVLRR